MSDADGEEWQKRLRTCVDLTRKWEDEYPRAIPPIGRRSVLAYDDAAWPLWPLSGSAWFGISSAIEHLGLLADMVVNMANGDTPLRPTAPFTLSRSALMGASQAVYLLSPARREDRVERSLLVARDELHNTVQFFGDYLKEDRRSEPDVLSPELRTNMESMQEHYRSLRKRTVEAIGSREKKLVVTTMMEEAAAHLAQTDINEPYLVHGLAYEWRVSSGAAHNRMWPALVRQAERTRTASGVEFRISANLQQLATSYSAAVLMLMHAMELWDWANRPCAAETAAAPTPPGVGALVTWPPTGL